jgi:hypothetical protein
MSTKGRPHLRPLRAAFLRQDPDIIMVGEIRDLETADISIKPPRPATWCCPRCTPTTPPPH